MRSRRKRARSLRLERLEPRAVPAALPFGALADDTAEFLLGDVLVSVVLMESNSQISAQNDNSETWTSQAIQTVKNKIQEGTRWWSDTLAAITDKHQLNFKFDFTFADSPVLTPYEPITLPSFRYADWGRDFLAAAGISASGDLTADVRRFNHGQRQKHDTHWAFTIFVVNDQNDADGQFAPGGFSRAFAFAGGRFFVMPAARPASTVAHELGHIFYARDEYAGGGTYNSFRGYYDTQNTNASDNPTPGFKQVPSIMDRGDCETDTNGLLCIAYRNHISSPSSLEMVGWRDSDSDGIFDVLDVPLTLEGTGQYDASAETYRFQGRSAVQTLPNRNSSGLQSDITINTVSRAEFRIDGGAWQTAAQLGGYVETLDLALPVPPTATTLQLRTVDATTGVTSPVFTASLSHPAAVVLPGLQGFVWQDTDSDGVWDSDESALAGREVRLVNADGTPQNTQAVLEPDDYPNAVLDQVLPGIRLRAVGASISDPSVRARTVAGASTGNYVFASSSTSCGGACTDWADDLRMLRIDFDAPVARVAIDAVGRDGGSYGRLEAYNSQGELVARVTSGRLTSGRVETLTIDRGTADISYVKAGSHADTTVTLDHLRVGVAPVTRTNNHGAFAFGPLVPGVYTVQAVAADGLRPTQPDNAKTTTNLTSGQAATDINFGFAAFESPWKNPRAPLDVNDDGNIAPIDVLLVINALNTGGARTLTNEPRPPYVDVSGDGTLAAHDALLIINFLNQPRGTAEAGGTVASPSTAAAHPRTDSAQRAAVWEPEGEAVNPNQQRPRENGRRIAGNTEQGRAASRVTIEPAAARARGESPQKLVPPASAAWDTALLDLLSDPNELGDPLVEKWAEWHEWNY